MTLILNLLWLVCGGFVTGCLWLIGGALLACTIVGIPWAFAAFRIAGFAFWPFGRDVVDRQLLTGSWDIGSGPVGLMLNIIWFLLAGWYIALTHLMLAILEAVTIIGLPFAYKDLQIAGLALAPIGKVVVDKRLVLASRALPSPAAPRHPG